MAMDLQEHLSIAFDLRECMRTMTGRYESNVMRYDVTGLNDR